MTVTVTVHCVKNTSGSYYSKYNHTYWFTKMKDHWILRKKIDNVCAFVRKYVYIIGKMEIQC